MLNIALSHCTFMAIAKNESSYSKQMQKLLDLGYSNKLWSACRRPLNEDVKRSCTYVAKFVNFAAKLQNEAKRKKHTVHSQVLCTEVFGDVVRNILYKSHP